MLKKMRQFYLLHEKWPTVSAQFKTFNITWSNICEILSLKDEKEIEYYLNISNKFNLTKRELRKKINLQTELVCN